MFGRSEDDAIGNPFEREPSAASAPGVPAALATWPTPASYLALEPQVVAELVRSALSSPSLATLRGGEVAVGAMLASLALRGEDGVLAALLPLDAEIRLHRYAVGHLSPVAVHPVGSLGELLRALSHAAAGEPGETWEAVAHSGVGDPVAVASARAHELRWLQPPAPGAPSSAPWSPVTTAEPAPGSSAPEWALRLTAPPPPGGIGGSAPVGSPAAAPLPIDIDTSLSLDPLGASRPVPAFGSPRGNGTADVVAAVKAAVEEALAAAPLELELDAATLAQLHDGDALTKLGATVARLEAQVGQVDAMNRQLAALTAAVEDLADSTRSLLRHQWDNMPPQGFWLRVQKADDEVRRAVDELAGEVRSRLRPAR